MSTNSLLQTLVDNMGKIVTIFTETGGAAGCGFTGILVSVDCSTCRLISELPSAPSHPFGANSANRSGCRRANLGTSVVIPTNAITAVVSNEI